MTSFIPSDSDDDDVRDPLSKTSPGEIGVVSSSKKYSRNSPKKLEQKRKLLPIWQYKDQILEQIQSSQVVIIEGEIGSGKSSQVPQWCLELSDVNQIVCTQTKRMDAISLAQRVAKEMNVRMGKKVGFVVRFDSKVSSKTVLKYVQDGILLRQVMQDRILSSYDVIIIDEVHERRLKTDVLLAIIKDILPLRSDLKVVLLCAIDVDKFCAYFNNCSHISIPRKVHPVKIVYSPTIKPRFEITGEDKLRFSLLPYINVAINIVLEICIMNKNEGDILVYATGRDEIDFICTNVREMIELHRVKENIGDIDIIPFHGDLPYTSQQKAFAPSPPSTPGKIGRKCIVSTNLAETIKIKGIAFVVDSGSTKLSFFRDGHLESLTTIETSQSTAKQRADSAAWAQHGICYRPYTREIFNQMGKDTIPEIFLCDLSNVILQLKGMGISLEQLGCIDQPTAKASEHAMYKLKLLGAINSQDEITNVGKLMSKFPVDTDVARMLVASQDYECQEEIITLAAVLSVDKTGSVFVFGGNNFKVKSVQSVLHHDSGDHLTFVNVYDAFILNDRSEEWCRANYVNYKLVSEAFKIRPQLLEMMTELQLINSNSADSVPVAHGNIMKAILTGLIGNIAQKDPMSFMFNKKKFVTVQGGYKVQFHPTCVVHYITCCDLFCYSSCIRKNSNKDFIRTVSSINEEWYDEIRAVQSAQSQAIQAPILKKLEIEKIVLSFLSD